MMNEAALKEIRSLALFSKLSDAHSECLRPGEIVEMPVGTVLASDGERARYFYLTLDGEIRLTRIYDRQEILMGVSTRGTYMGETPLLLDIPWRATARVSKPARLFRLDEEDFWKMISTCHSVTREIFRIAANKVRNFEGYSQQREKLAALGTMAAGLAHELNNPAAAGRRAAVQLKETSESVQSYLCQLGKKLEHEHWQPLLAAAQEAAQRLTETPQIDPLTRSDRAEAIARWLETHNVAMPWEVAPTFVSAGLDVPWLEALAAKLPPSGQPSAFGWLEARLNLNLLVRQVEQSTGRIAELVKAVKSYSYMDQSPMQEIDIHEGIETTLTMLGHKLKNVTVKRAFDRSLPRIMAYGSELNQVWTNLIDNAIYAVQGTGKICIGTCREDNQVVVEIVDNGSGIPLEIQAHLFEPFFTTKPVGSGTGLGLIISNRIVADRHGGEIEFESKPGETWFKVRLPIQPAAQAAALPNGKVD